MNCKVIKKWQPSPASPHFYMKHPFQVYPCFLAKKFVSPPSPSDSIPLIMGGGGSNYEKWPKMVFLRKSCDLSEICVKSKILWFINILWKLHPWRKSCSQVIAKNGSQPVRFQHSLIVNVSLIERYLTLIFGM